MPKLNRTALLSGKPSSGSCQAIKTKWEIIPVWKWICKRSSERTNLVIKFLKKPTHFALPCVPNIVIIQSLWILLMNWLLLSGDWESPGWRNRHTANLRGKRKNWPGKPGRPRSQMPRACPQTCLHVHVLSALHGLRRPRPELLLGSLSGKGPLLSPTLSLDIYIAELPTLRATEKASKV